MSKTLHNSLFQKWMWPFSALLMLALGVAAFIYREERIYGDASYYLLQIINRENFLIVHGRPSSIFIEWLPVLLVQMHAPLAWVIDSLSVAEFLWIAISFFCFGVLLKSKPHAIAVVLVYLFGIRWNYFNPVSELLLAFPVFLLFDYLIRREYKSLLLWGVLLGIAWFLLCSHPLYALPLLSLSAMLFVTNGRKNTYLVVVIVLCFLSVLRFLLLDGYDRVAAETTSQQLGWAETLTHFVYFPYLIDLSKAFVGITFFSATGIALLWRRSLKLQAIICFGYAASVVIIVVLNYGKLYPSTFEPFERYLFPLTLGMVALLIPVWNNASKFLLVGLMLVCAWHVFYLFNYGQKTVDRRFRLLQTAIYNTRQWDATVLFFKKAHYFPAISSNRNNGHDWTMNCESLLMSARMGKDSTKQIFIQEVLPDDFYNEAKPSEFLLATSGWKEPLSALNPFYFNPRPTPWRCAQTDSINTAEIFTAKNMEVDWIIAPSRVKSNAEFEVLVELYNKSVQTVFSRTTNGDKGIVYVWKNADGQIIKNDHVLAPFMCDWKESLRQHIVVHAPSAAGTYYLELCIIDDTNSIVLPLGKTQRIDVH